MSDAELCENCGIPVRWYAEKGCWVQLHAALILRHDAARCRESARGDVIKNGEILGIVS